MRISMILITVAAAAGLMATAKPTLAQTVDWNVKPAATAGEMQFAPRRFGEMGDRSFTVDELVPLRTRG